ncbi:hypothetical protein KA005_68635, partial [bacterium]|nr:hypothetical protein [bacterium]
RIPPAAPLYKPSTSFEEYLHEKGLAETTIEYKLRLIRYLELRLNRYDSDSIKEHLRNNSCSNRRKNNISYAYRDCADGRDLTIR